MGPRKGHGLRVAAGCCFFQQGTAGITKSEGPGDLVKGFTGSVIARPGDDFEAFVVVDDDEMAVGAGNNETEKRRFPGGIGEVVGRDVAGDVMDPDQWFAGGGGQAFGGGQANQQGTDQAWSIGHGNGVDIGERGAGLGQGLVDHGQDGFDMHARGDFWYNTAILLVYRSLGGDDVGPDLAAVGDDCGSSFIAG